MSAGAALARAARALAEAGIENAALDARLLLQHATGWPAEALIARERVVPPAAFAALDALVARRAAREPLAYLTGTRGFWRHEFSVTRDTLIPRPDSEAVVEAALALLPDRPARVVDFGTGSGCLLLSILGDRPRAWGVGVDASPGTLAVAAANARALGLADRAAFVAADWGAALAGRFDLIVANPPYIRSGDMTGLAPELAHEPPSALAAGADGLAAYRALVPHVMAGLAAGGHVVLEVGAGQASDVEGIFGFLRALPRHRDLGQVERAVCLTSQGLGL